MSDFRQITTLFYHSNHRIAENIQESNLLKPCFCLFWNAEDRGRSHCTHHPCWRRSVWMYITASSSISLEIPLWKGSNCDVMMWPHWVLLHPSLISKAIDCGNKSRWESRRLHAAQWEARITIATVAIESMQHPVLGVHGHEHGQPGFLKEGLDLNTWSIRTHESTCHLVTTFIEQLWRHWAGSDTTRAQTRAGSGTATNKQLLQVQNVE